MLVLTIVVASIENCQECLEGRGCHHHIALAVLEDQQY